MHLSGGGVYSTAVVIQALRLHSMLGLDRMQVLNMLWCRCSLCRLCCANRAGEADCGLCTLLVAWALFCHTDSSSAEVLCEMLVSENGSCHTYNCVIRQSQQISWPLFELVDHCRARLGCYNRVRFYSELIYWKATNYRILYCRQEIVS